MSSATPKEKNKGARQTLFGIASTEWAVPWMVASFFVLAWFFSSTKALPTGVECAILLAVLGLATAFRMRSAQIVFPPRTGVSRLLKALFMLFVAAAITSGLMSIKPPIALYCFFIECSFFVMFLVLARREDDLFDILRSFVVLSLITLVAVFLFRYASDPSGMFRGKRLSMGFNSAVLGMFLYAVFFALNATGEKANIPPIIVHVLNATLFLIAFSTGTRSVIILYIITLMMFYFSAIKSSNKKLTLSAAAIPITSLAIYVLFNYSGFLSLLSRFYNMTTITQRFHVWENIISIWSQHPWLGVGYSMHRFHLRGAFGAAPVETLPFPYINNIKGAYFSHSHNEYLGLLSDLGIVGVLLIFSMLAIIVYFTLRQRPIKLTDKISFIFMSNFAIISMSETMHARSGRFLWFMFLFFVAHLASRFFLDVARRAPDGAFRGAES